MTNKLAYIIMSFVLLSGCSKELVKKLSKGELVETEKASYAPFYEKMVTYIPENASILLESVSNYQGRLWSPVLRKEYKLTIYTGNIDWNKERIILNKILLVDIPNSQPDMRGDEISSLFNTSIKVNKTKVNEQSKTGSTEELIPLQEGFGFFIPDDIYFTEPYTGTPSSKPRIVSPRYTVKWNAQPENPNGVAVIVEYTGAVEGQYLRPVEFSQQRRKIGLFDDDGEAHLDERYFEGIPSGAMIKISILRGNAVEKKIDGTPVYIRGYSEEMGYFVMEY